MAPALLLLLPLLLEEEEEVAAAGVLDPAVGAESELVGLAGAVDSGRSPASWASVALKEVVSERL